MFKEIDAKAINENVFDLIGNKWMLIAAKKADGSVNAMTASWGGMGVMWNENVAFIVIRPQRFTKEFVDEAEEFSLSFFDESYKKMLSYMGTVSGRDEDKINVSNLHVSGDVPVFEESRMTIICKKMFAQPLLEESFLDENTINKWYSMKDYHILYFGKIEKVLVK